MAEYECRENYRASKARIIPCIATTTFSALLLIHLHAPATMDTILLPVTIFIEPERPPRGYSDGCEWAARR